MHAPTGTASARAMIDALDAVLARIDRELSRAPARGEGASTARVGGITRLGATLDAYLLSVWCWVCARHGLDPAAAARSISADVLLDRATAGQLFLLLGSRAGHPVAAEPAVRWIFAELRLGSALHRVISLRNQIVHARVAPDPEEISRVLSALRSALVPQRALLGSPS